MPLPDAPPLTPARPLHVTYLGNFGSPHSTENHIARSLEWMGHQVLKIQEDHGCWGTIPETVSATESDLLLWTRTLSLDSERDVQRNGLAKIAKLGIPTVGYHLDKYWDLPRETLIDTEPFFRVDRLYTADGGNQARWEAADVNHFYLPPAVCHLECAPGHPHPDLEADIAFVGSYEGYHEQWPHRRQLIDWLKAEYPTRFRLYPSPGMPAIRGEALRDLYASVKVCVGDSCMVGGRGFYFSDRCMESTGRGGFLLHPWTRGLPFSSGRHLDTWTLGDWDMLRDKIDHYLVYDQLRQDIAKCGRSFVLDHHTYVNRMQTVINDLRLT